MLTARTSSLAVAILGTLIVACSGAEDGASLIGGGSGHWEKAGAPNEQGSGALSGTPASLSCSDTNAQDQEGCGCAQATRSCFTGHPASRGKPGCSDGSQSCTKKGEFSVWGPCEGAVTACTNGGTGSGGTADAGTGSANDAGGSAVCTADCVPGTQRWCDSPEGCNFGKQDCRPDGHWGVCVEVAEKPAGCGGSDPTYDEDCCLASGACCQDFDGFDENLSKGQCGGIACSVNIAP